MNQYRVVYKDLGQPDNDNIIVEIVTAESEQEALNYIINTGNSIRHPISIESVN